MKQKPFKYLLSILLVISLLVIMSSAAFAADDESVLTSIKYDGTSLSLSGKSATLTVEYSYSGTVDFSSNLDIKYNTTTYSTAVAQFLDGSVAEVGGGSVTMTVSYERSDEPGVTYTSNYSINVVKAAYEEPTFSGNISKIATYPSNVSFSSTDFTSKYDKNDGTALGSIVISGSNPTFGELQLSGDTYELGTSISASSLGSLKFVPTDSGSVSYTVTAYDSESNEVDSVFLTITIEEPVASDITYSIYENDTVTLSAPSFNSICDNMTGNTLSYVKFTLPSSSSGILYYNYTSSGTYDSAVSATTSYYYNQAPYLSKVTFVPKATGTVTISYTAYDTTGDSYTGKVKITVSENTASTISYSVYNDEEVTFSSSTFNSICYNLTGETLNYVKFTLPSTTYGKLYYGYTSSSSYDSAVSSTTKYYYKTSPYISKVTFVPKSTYTGTVTITYTGYDTEGESYSGTIKITVKDGGGDADVITYEIDEDEELTFDRSDFDDVCDDYCNDDLDYIKFTLPSTSYGKLYYNYTSSSDYDDTVSSTDKYYYSSTPYISKVTLVPKSGYTGTFYITYTAYPDDEDSYTGKIKVVVGDGSGVDTITYEIDEDEEITFDRSDFDDVCDDYCNDDLDYVKFTLPSSTYGKLYYNYTSSSDYDDTVSSSDKYYYSSSPYISKVTFVPKSGYSGTFYITYTAYPDDEDSYTGKIKVIVGDGSGVDTITYEIDEDEDLTFDRSDFDDVCDDYCDDDLDYIKFTLPSSTYGKLYYNYTSSSDYDDTVSSSDKYYYSSSPYISKVTFVPKSGYTGTFYIKYTAYPDDEDSYTGKIKVVVGDADSADTITYTVYNTSTLSFSASDFNEVCDDLTDDTLSYVKFTLPSSSSGKLYYNYTSSSNYDSAVYAGTKYYYKTSPYISKITFVPSSSYTGTVTINYTGYNTDGDSYSGSVKIVVTGSTTTTTGTSQYFTDVKSNYSWAASSIDYLYQNGVVAGTSANEFGPQKNITRADFIVMLCRAFNLKAANGVTTNFSDVNTKSYYYSSVIIAKSLGIAEGSGGYFYPTSNLTREDAMVLILRTLKVSGKTLTTGTTSDLSTFSDRGQISSYATDAVATLVKAGIVKGSTATTVNPKGSITRAEMAVILYRILNM